MNRTIRWRYSSIGCLLLIFSALGVFAQDVYLCVWRNPERTMTKIFPEARDYISANQKISPSQLEEIEKRIGTKVLPGQRDVFLYFNMTGDNGEHVGTIIAVTQKGEFGAVEFVFGLDPAGVIEDLYVQRARERDQRFKKRDFLDLFVGQNVRGASNLEKTYQGAKTPGTTAIIEGLEKALTAYDVLVLNGENKD